MYVVPLPNRKGCLINIGFTKARNDGVTVFQINYVILSTSKSKLLKQVDEDKASPVAWFYPQ